MPGGKKPGQGVAEAAPHFHGHFERARERIAASGPDALQDYELLELVLHLLLPRRDTKPLAKALIDRFGSFAGVLGADPQRLAEVKAIDAQGRTSGLGATSTENLKLIQAAAQRYAKGQIKADQPILSSWAALLDYCRAQMAFAEKEQFRILFLDKKNKLVADEVQQTGTVDHTPVYPREVIKRALEHNASALILVHNHPSGDPAPSSADVQMTRQIAQIATPLGITVHDHIIIGKTGHASLKALKLI